MKSAGAVAKVQSPVSPPGIAIAAAPGPADEIASLERKLEGAISRDRVHGEKQSGLQARSTELSSAISSGNTQLLDLKRRLAIGDDVETELEAGERTVRGFERQREGVESLIADVTRERESASAEISKLSEALSRRRFEQERDSVADEADRADILMWETSAALIRTVAARELLIGRLIDQFNGTRIFTERILGRRDERRGAAVAELRKTNRTDLNGLLPPV